MGPEILQHRWTLNILHRDVTKTRSLDIVGLETSPSDSILDLHYKILVFVVLES